jgi:uncharacterized membrane protein
MENLNQILIYIHAFLGGIALCFGMLALLSKKGNKLHKKAGIIFYYSMLGSAMAALIIATIPNHENLFLFLIGIFSTYFLIGGYRCLNFKNVNFNLTIDKIIAWIMLLTGTSMIFIPIILNNEINIILFVFGTIGLIFSSRDLILYRTKEGLKKKWLKIHVGKMMGGYISAFSAFMVVNQFFSGIINWFLPGLLGGIYITYWMKKLNKKKAL